MTYGRETRDTKKAVRERVKYIKYYLFQTGLTKIFSHDNYYIIFVPLPSQEATFAGANGLGGLASAEFELGLMHRS